MGGVKWFEGGREWREYETVDIIDRIKVVRRIKGEEVGTPYYSNTSKFLMTYNKETKRIKQIACYDEKTHGKIYDIDWDHPHTGFKVGEPHVHYYDYRGRSKDAVGPNEEQLRLFNKYANREVRIK